METETTRQNVHLAALSLLLALLACSGLRPYDRLTWLLEVAPILLALPILILTYRRFRFSDLCYALIFVHALILMLGGAYTYARVPLGFWVERWFSLPRNPYDKLGHLFQGLVPALVAREVLIRGQHVRGRRMLGFLVICIALAISAAYELVEWLSALSLGQGADEFLGTQGDPWDTQTDMAAALLGSILALAVFSRFQDRQIRRQTRELLPGSGPA